MLHLPLEFTRPNSSHQPTTCRSLGRRFRASFCATLRVALPESEGTWRLRKNVGQTEREAGAPDPGCRWTLSPDGHPRVESSGKFAMKNPDLLLYAVHNAFWASFGGT